MSPSSLIRGVSVPQPFRVHGVPPAPAPYAQRLYPQVLASTMCVPPSYAERLCPGLCWSAVVPPKRGRLVPAGPLGFVTRTLPSAPSPTPHTPWAEEPSHSSPCCHSPSPGQKRLENPGAVGKSRSGCAAEPGLRLPRPRRQGPPARPPPNAQAPSWPGTAASATLPGPAQPCRRGR